MVDFNTSITEKLKHNIENLYKVFAQYEARDMTAKPLYEDLPKWNQAMRSKPLRELDEDDLSRFTRKAVTTWGSANDYKHFLPRIFELIAELRAPYEIWIAIEKLTLAEWQQWPEEEQKVVQEFMLALWESILNDDSEKAEWKFNDYFSALAHFYPNFTDLLDIWTLSESKAAIKHLAEFIIDEQTELFDRKRISGFHAQKENAEELIEWILSDNMLNKLEKAYFEFEGERFADKISWAEQIITNERKRKAQNKG